jgi:hypothetical protein
MEALAEETDASTTLVINDPGTVTKPAGAPSFKRAFRGQAACSALDVEDEPLPAGSKPGAIGGEPPRKPFLSYMQMAPGYTLDRTKFMVSPRANMEVELLGGDPYEIGEDGLLLRDKDDVPKRELAEMFFADSELIPTETYFEDYRIKKEQLETLVTDFSTGRLLVPCPKKTDMRSPAELQGEDTRERDPEGVLVARAYTKACEHQGVQPKMSILAALRDLHLQQAEMDFSALAGSGLLLGDRGAACLFTALGSLPKTVSLGLSHLGLGNHSMVALCNLLSASPNVQQVDLTGNRISDRGAKTLLQFVLVVGVDRYVNFTLDRTCISSPMRVKLRRGIEKASRVRASVIMGLDVEDAQKDIKKALTAR